MGKWTLCVCVCWEWEQRKTWIWDGWVGWFYLLQLLFKMRFLLCCLLDVVSVGPKGTRTAALFIFFYISLEVASPPASATLAPSSWGRDSLCGAWSGTRAWLGQVDGWDGAGRRAPCILSWASCSATQNWKRTWPTAPRYRHSSYCLESQALPGEWQMHFKQSERNVGSKLVLKQYCLFWVLSH